MCYCPRSENDPSNWQVYVGKYHCSTSDTTDVQIKLSQIVKHPAFNNETLESDIAVLVSEVNCMDFFLR